MSYSRGSSWPRDRTRVSCVSYIGRPILYHFITRETQNNVIFFKLILINKPPVCIQLFLDTKSFQTFQDNEVERWFDSPQQNFIMKYIQELQARYRWKKASFFRTQFSSVAQSCPTLCDLMNQSLIINNISGVIGTKHISGPILWGWCEWTIFWSSPWKQSEFLGQWRSVQVINSLYPAWRPRTRGKDQAQVLHKPLPT